MTQLLNELHSIEALQQVIEESMIRPVLLFKHSTSCPISGRAFRHFQSYLETADPQVSYHLITVQTDRPVSNEATTKLGVQHETPQAILIRDGREIWHASHFEITAATLQAAIQNSQKE